MSLPLLHATPRRHHLRPLTLPADQRDRLGRRDYQHGREFDVGSCRQTTGGRRVKPGDPFVRERGLRVRLDAKLPLEQRFGRVVDLQRSRSIVVQRMKAHQVPAHGLVDGVESEADMAVLDGGAIVALLLQQRDQAVEDPLMAGRQSLAVRGDPFLVGTG